MSQTAPTTHSSAPALEVRRLTASYNAAPVLWDVDASFPQKALSAIVGPNGAGKSTLLAAALGLVPADAGQTLILGRPVRSVLGSVAYVPQREAVDWDFPITVREVVEMGRYPMRGWLRRLRRSDHAVIDECLERVGMAPFGTRQIGQLSGGQRQRVFVARALAQQAQVMLLDEPFAGVDARTEASLLELLRQLRDEGRSIIVVHHNLAAVQAHFDWALVLNVRAVACGPVESALRIEVLERAYGSVPDMTEQPRLDTGSGESGMPSRPSSASRSNNGSLRRHDGPADDAAASDTSTDAMPGAEAAKT